MSTIINDPEHDTDPELPSYITHDIHEVNLHNPPPAPLEEDTLISNLEPEPKENKIYLFVSIVILFIMIIIYVVFIILLR